MHAFPEELAQVDEHRVMSQCELLTILHEPRHHISHQYMVLMKLCYQGLPLVFFTHAEFTCPVYFRCGLRLNIHKILIFCALHPSQHHGRAIVGSH